MSSIISDDTHNLLNDNSFELDCNKNENNLLCTVCNRLLNDACETSCGCNYCYECIAKYLNEGKKYCCGGKELCKEETLELNKNVTRNAKLNRMVLNTKVICPRQFCKYSCLLSLMSDHMRVCTPQFINCPYNVVGCNNDSITKDNLESHLFDSSLDHANLLIDWFNNIKNDFETHKSDITNIKSDSKVKESRIKYLEVDSKLQKNEITIVKQKLSDTTEELKTAKEEMTELKNLISKLEKKLDGKHSYLLTKVTNDIKEIDSKVCAFKEDIGNKLTSIGVIAFILDRFIARKAAKEIVFSPHFYTHTNGYKVKLKVYVSGNDSDYAQYLSAGIVICKGEYDDILTWPCKYSFVISIMSQDGGEDIITGTLVYSSSTPTTHFNKPVYKDNDVYGFPGFVSHNDLQTTKGILKNDSIMIKCIAAEPE